VENRIKVELAALEAAEQAFQRTSDQLSGVLDELDVQLQTSLHAWSGEAQHAYRRRHSEWIKSARDMVTCIDDLHRVIVQARRNYHASLRANHSMWHPA